MYSKRLNYKHRIRYQGEYKGVKGKYAGTDGQKNNVHGLEYSSTSHAHKNKLKT